MWRVETYFLLMLVFCFCTYAAAHAGSSDMTVLMWRHCLNQNMAAAIELRCWGADWGLPSVHTDSLIVLVIKISIVCSRETLRLCLQSWAEQACFHFYLVFIIFLSLASMLTQLANLSFSACEGSKIMFRVIFKVAAAEIKLRRLEGLISCSPSCLYKKKPVVLQGQLVKSLYFIPFWFNRCFLVLK